MATPYVRPANLSLVPHVTLDKWQNCQFHGAMASTLSPTHPADSFDDAPPADRRRWAILAVLCTSLLLVMLGNTALNLALPSIAADLGLSSSAQQWVVDSYSLVFAGLLFTTSSLGDRFGRKGVMQAGLVMFTLASGFAAFFATSGGGLIAARGVMGLSGAMIMPSTLSILTNVFPAGQRARAIAIWTAVSGGGAAIGMMVSGFMLEHWSWSSVFLLNLPVGAVALIAGMVLVPTSRDPEKPRLDFLGAALSTAGIATVVYGLIEAPTHGWTSASTLGVLVGGLALVGAFVAWELRTSSPMLDIRLFRKATFGVSSLALTLVFFALMGVFFSVSQLFQLVMGYGTFESALRLAPVFVAMILVAPQAPKIVQRFGARATVAGGLGLVAAGIGILALLPGDPGYAQVALGLTVTAGGMALAMTPTTELLMSSVPVTKAGMGAAMNDTTRELGGSLGVAVLGSVLASQYASNISAATSGLPTAAVGTARASLAGALHVATALPVDQAGRLAAAARSAWMSGLTVSMIVGALIIVVAAAIARFGLPGNPATDEAVADVELIDDELVPVAA
jgi:EmrB/QacA subfamily drug resistance transporter